MGLPLEHVAQAGRARKEADSAASAAATIGPRIVPLLPRLRRFALGLCRSQTEADDLVQSACERALARAHQWQAGTRIDSWMFRIVQNLYIDQVRAQRSRGRHQDLDESTHSDSDLSGSNSTPADLRVELSEVERAIQRLSDEHRCVLMLVCVDGQSYREAAEVLSVPVGTVMSRLARARGQLARLIGPAARGGSDSR